MYSGSSSSSTFYDNAPSSSNVIIPAEATQVVVVRTGWAAGAKKNLGFFYPKRKQSLPLQSHYLSLPVGGSASSATGMYMLHSEDLSVTEFAKLAGITILPEVDDSITYEEAPVNIANEIHEHHRRGSSAELSVGLDCAGAGGAGVAGSAGNTLNSGVSLTVGSSGSERGGSRKTNIWDPQFWSDPVVRDGTTKVLLPSTSTASLPIPSGSGSFAPWRKYPPVPVRSSAPSSPKLQPQIRANCIQTTASLARLGNGGRGSTVPFGSVGGSSQQEQQQQRRRNSCSPAVLMPAAGSRTAAAAAGGGCEIDRARQCTPSDVSSSSKRVDQQQPRPPNNKQDTIQLSQDLGRRRSFTSLTAVALELEGRGGNDTGQQPVGGGGSGLSLERRTVWDHSLQGGGGAGGGLLVGDPVTATTTRSTQQYIPPPQSMSHTLAMNALQTPRSRGSVTGGSSGHSSNVRSGSSLARTRSPSPSPLSRQIDLDSLDSPLEEHGGGGMELLSPTLVPPVSVNQRQSFAHGKSGASKSKKTTVASGSANRHLVPTITTTTAPGMVHHRAQSMPLSPSDQKLNHAQVPPRTPPLPPARPPSSASSMTSMTGSRPPTPSTPSRSSTPSGSRPSTPTGRTFAPGTKVGRFTLVQERCTKHVDLLKAQQQQQAQRRDSLGEIGSMTTISSTNGSVGDKDKEVYGPSTSLSSPSLAVNGGSGEEMVDDGAEWIESPMLKEENVRVFQPKRSRRTLYQHQHIPPPPPVSY
ncbi:hypothetical protein BGX29_003957 [Mortierella sp. GBA35]|nr:hypothetical protein BGX29_003957 [Mortierella sp. GBA35]